MGNLLTDPKFAAVVAHFERACRASRLHSSGAARVFANYGDQGPLISGCAMRDNIAALDEISEDVADAKRGTIADMLFGEYFA